MGATEKRFNAIDGVSTYYMRDDNSRKIRPASFSSTDETYDTLVHFKRDLDAYTRPAGYGAITVIASAGAYVNKPGKHGQGNAFDLDQVRWESGRWCSPIYGVHNHSKQWARLRYYALDAVCRQWFGTVLDGNYNAAHRDHIHAARGTRIGLTRSAKSEMKFIQAICNEFAGQNLKIDGAWGPKTSAAFNIMLAEAGLGRLKPFTSVRDYRKLLQRISQNGFRGQTFIN
ncbi:MAG: extensin family protein [Acidimicrobiales bacterium]